MANIIEIIPNLAAIAEGYVRTILRIKTPIMVYREKNYCMKCPLAHKDGVYTGFCGDSERGCNCRISVRTSQNQVGCPLGFFANNWFKEDQFKEFIKENIQYYDKSK